jgi:signal transduction histidine kinase
LSLNAFSQINSISKDTVQKLISIAEKCQTDKPADFFKYLNLAYKLADITRDYESLYKVQKSYGDYYYNIGNIELSTKHYKRCLDITIKNNFLEKQADVCIFLGINYDETGLKQIAVEYYLEAANLYQLAGNEIGFGMAQHNLGIILQTQKQFDKAIIYYQQSLEIEQKHKNFNGIALSLYDIAFFYYNTEKPDSMLRYCKLFDKSLKYVDDTSLFNLSTSAYSNYFSLIGDYKKSIELLYQTRDYYYNGNQDSRIAMYQVDIANNLINLNRDSEAILHLDTALIFCDSSTNIYTFQRILENQRDAHFNLQDYEIANKYSERYTNLLTSIYQQENKQLITESEIKYETEKQKKNIEILTANSEIQALKMNRFKWTIFFGLFALLSGTIFTFIIFRQSRYRKNINDILNKKNQELAVINATKDKFFTIIAHDIKNPLSAFTSITQMLTENLRHLNKEDIEEYVSELNKSSLSLQQLLSNLLQWAMTQTNAIRPNLTIFRIHEIVDENISQLKSNASKKNIKIVNLVNCEIDINSDRNILKTVIFNLVSNAIKFTPNDGKIEINYESNLNYQKIKITDSGIGMSQTDLAKLFKIEVNTKTIGNSNEKGTGLGLLLCKELINKIDGNIEVESQIGIGSTFSIILPKI